MRVSRERIMEDVLGLLRQLAGDWEYTGEINADTRFFADMGLQSLDVVILGTAIQEHYRRRLPFGELFTRVGQRCLPDIPVSEWVDFIYQQLRRPAAGAADAPQAHASETT